MTRGFTRGHGKGREFIPTEGRSGKENRAPTRGSSMSRIHRRRDMDKIEVTVPAHESHSKDGKVERVEGYSYSREDTGAPGRTPEENRWYEANGTLHGWSTSQNAEERRKALERTADAEGWAKTDHKLQGLRNVTTDERTKREAKADQKWIRREHGEALHRSLQNQRPNPVTG